MVSDIYSNVFITRLFRSTVYKAYRLLNRIGIYREMIGFWLAFGLLRYCLGVVWECFAAFYIALVLFWFFLGFVDEAH